MYLALYRKYRPQTFADVISQSHITQTLSNQINSGKAAHAYLFTGSRGTGKTTCAKILAKAVNCLNPTDGNPCLQCEACLAIDNGITDVVEIDAASNNSVNDVRILRDELTYLPVSCKYRVYIIDEVHMLSGSAFNALLKTIEEPPGHVVFILATTETHKVPATILSRCQRFDFRRINIRESADRLLQIAAKEGAELETDAALLISRLSEGGMRDALSLLDTCLSVSKNVSVSVVSTAAGLAGSEYLFNISESAAGQNPAAAIEIINRLHENSKDLTRLIDELIYHYRNLMLVKSVPQSPHLLTCLPGDEQRYNETAAKLHLSEILRCLRILENCFERIGRSKNAKITAEMAVIELCSPTVDFDLAAVAARVSVLEDKIKGANLSTASQLSASPIKETPNKPVQKKNNEDSPIPMPDFPAETPIAEEIPPPWGEPPPAQRYYREILPEPPAEAPLPAEAPRTAQPPKPSEPVPAPIPSVTYNGTFSAEHWRVLTAELPPFLGELMSDTTAFIEGERLFITGGAIAGGLLENPVNKQKILSIAERITGKKLSIAFLESQAPLKKEISKADTFIALAREAGLEVKIK